MASEMKQAVQQTVTELGSNHNLIEYLETEQRGALNNKFLTLAEETRDQYGKEYPGLTNAERYVLRLMIRSANGMLASKKRPTWRSALADNAKWLRSGDATLKATGEKMLKALADSIDSKEAVNLLKWYKVQQDTTSHDPFIITLCNLFGVDHTALK